MDKKTFIENLSKRIKLDEVEVERVYDVLLEEISQALTNGEKVSISDFGTFTPKMTKARKAFSALLNKEIEISSKRKISFSLAKNISEKVDKKHSKLEPKKVQDGLERKIEKSISPLEATTEEKAESEIEPGSIEEVPDEISESIKKSEIAEQVFEDKDEILEKIISSESSKTADEVFKDKDEIFEKLISGEEIETTEEPVKMEFEEPQKTGEEKDLSLKEELFENIISKELNSDIGKEKEVEPEKIKTEEAKMPNMNLNEGEKKFVLGEEIRPSAGAHPKPTPPISHVGRPSREGSSPAMWVTLIVLFIIVIGAGIYWALSSDVTKEKERKSESIVQTERKTSTPPVLVEDQKTKAVDTIRRKPQSIILAPEELSVRTTEPTKVTKEPLLVEEKKAPSLIETKKEVVPTTKEITKSEPPTTTTRTEIIPKQENIKQKLVTPKKKRITTSKTPLVKKKISPPTEEATEVTGEYAIQVASFKNEALANSEVKRLRAKGFRAYVEPYDAGMGGMIYRVRVGTYKNEESAAKDYHALRLMLKSENIYVDRRY